MTSTDTKCARRTPICARCSGSCHAGPRRLLARAIFTWRAAHLVVIPLLSLLAAGTTLAWIAHTRLFGAVTVLALALVTVGAITLARGKRAISALLAVPLVALLSTVVLVALIKHPFSRQTANYPKIATAPPDIQEDPIL